MRSWCSFPGTLSFYSVQFLGANPPPYTDDEVYFWAFEEIVPTLIHVFQPVVVVIQLGVDSFYNDPLTNLQLSMLGFEKVVRRIKELAPRWVALGGGGYDVSNIDRAWTLTWVVMNGIELSDELPKSYLEKTKKVGVYEKELKDDPPPRSQSKEIRIEVECVVNYLKKTVIPKIGA